MQAFMRLALVALVWGSLSGSVWSQAARRPPTPGTKAIDQQAEKVQNDYLRGLAELATKYEEAGDVNKASEMLNAILKIKPEVESVKKKLNEFAEAPFKENSFTVELDTSSGWFPAGVQVSANKPIRIQAEGTYRYTASNMLGPAGFSAEDLVRDAVSGIPLGGLMAVVAKPPEQNQNPARTKDQPRAEPHPVFVGTQTDFTPSETGVLLFRVNVPASTRCTGKIKIKISGHVAAAR